MSLKDVTPYILFALGQTIFFVVWIIRQNGKFEKKIVLMETKIESLKKEQAQMKTDQKEINAEIRADQKEFNTKLSLVSELMAVCKNTVDWMLAKNMKKGTA